MTLAWFDILPIRTVSEANSREHWAVKNNRHRQQKRILAAACKSNPLPHDLHLMPLFLKLTRVAPRMLDQHDNLPTSFKSILDGLCSLILPGHKPGRADAKLNLTIEYSQRKGAPKQYAVEIKIYVPSRNCPQDNSHVS